MTRGRLVALVLVFAVAAGVSTMLRGGGDLEPTVPDDAGFELMPVATDQPPPWRLERVGGGHLSLSDFKGSVTILYFWASW